MDKNSTNKHDKKVDKKEIIIELETKLVEMENNWKRALADYKNLEKRTNEEKSAVMDFASSGLLEKLLTVLDNFEMLQQHTNDEGLNITIKDFKQTLESMGLNTLDVKIGDSFDHTKMDAIDTQNGDKDRILSIIRKGYLFKNKLIRPASVKVGNGIKPNNVKED
ncbi:nucleotide exchange factor GrpE [candidate division WWE3 bacterium RBG_19FT_COMBO_34_6]|uniref:Protein GrpE n=1 Tax=candidate division WWE3 bacterium RBG_19FT_COMBO_34_6 TaxID=1802612 RepID=A0A1F4UML7_UNCKA|nr:MAG: nucleotide exchange factor GrpE [candidate division WWE3 bacterium RBG_19FT_COMBO_34_6]